MNRTHKNSYAMTAARLSLAILLVWMAGWAHAEENEGGSGIDIRRAAADPNDESGIIVRRVPPELTAVPPRERPPAGRPSETREPVGGDVGAPGEVRGPGQGAAPEAGRFPEDERPGTDMPSERRGEADDAYEYPPRTPELDDDYTDEEEADDGLPTEPGGYIEQGRAENDWTTGQMDSLIPSEPVDIDSPDEDALQEQITPPPDYFEPANMIDGFWIVPTAAATPLLNAQWRVTPAGLFLRSTQLDGRPGIDLIWPEAAGGGNYYQRVDGALTNPAGETLGTFWINPTDERGRYWRYFDTQDSRILHWVGLEIPNAEEAAEAAELYQWLLVEPTQRPRDWRGIPQVLEYRRSSAQGQTETRYVYIYLMPVDALPRGYTPVELRLVHRSSGRFLGMDRHMMFIP